MTTDLRTVLELLASRPECVHGLNGPCTQCGPSLSLAQAAEWQQALCDLDEALCGY